MVDHHILKQRLFNIELSNNFTDRSHYVKYDGNCSDVLSASKGVPQGSVLGPLLFCIYMSYLGQDMTDCHFYFYADDRVIYCWRVSNLAEAAEHLQTAFTVLHNTLSIKLVLNAKVTTTGVEKMRRLLKIPGHSDWWSLGCRWLNWYFGCVACMHFVPCNTIYCSSVCSSVLCLFKITCLYLVLHPILAMQDSIEFLFFNLNGTFPG